jgi:hypothetical protein
MLLTVEQEGVKLGDHYFVHDFMGPARGARAGRNDPEPVLAVSPGLQPGPDHRSWPPRRAGRSLRSLDNPYPAPGLRERLARLGRDDEAIQHYERAGGSSVATAGRTGLRLIYLARGEFEAAQPASGAAARDERRRGPSTCPGLSGTGAGQESGGTPGSRGPCPRPGPGGRRGDAQPAASRRSRANG